MLFENMYSFIVMLLNDQKQMGQLPIRNSWIDIYIYTGEHLLFIYCVKTHMHNKPV